MTWFDLQNLHWREPLFLLIAMQPLLLIALRRLREHKRLMAYADPALHPWVVSHEKRRLLTRIFSRDSAYLLAWLLFSISASGPRLAQEIPGAPVDSGVDIMTVLDISQSMHTKDIHPSRLLRTRIELHEFMDRLNHERLGMVVYAARPHLLSPLTTDYDALGYYLNILDTLVLPTLGSNPVDAIIMAQQQFKQDSKQKKAIMLVTDGDFASFSEPYMNRLQLLVSDLGKQKISLHILGMGTVEGDAVPDTVDGWLLFNGKPVVSHMDESSLQKLASLGGGLYSQVTDDDSDWSTLHNKGISSDNIGKLDDAGKRNIIWHELYPLALLPAIILLFLSLIPYKLSSQYLHRKNNVLLPAIGLFIFLFLPIDKLLAADNDHELETRAFSFYQSEKYKDAIAAYLALPGYRGRLGEGAAAYRLEDYSRAVKQFSQAMLEANNDAQRAAALFNLGNSYFKTGNYAAAITTFNDALLYRPEHRPTQKNLAFSETLLKAVQQQLGELGTTDRMGRGPRLARAQDSLDINEAGAVSFGENDAQDKEKDLVLPDGNDSSFEILIARGIEHARLASSNDAGSGVNIFTEDATELSQARLYMRKLEHHQTVLWKRMFEFEEGFSAPQTEPRLIPGIAPW